MENKLPEEIQKQIKNEAQGTLARASQDLTYSAGYFDGYTIGATEWAQWKVKHDELKLQLETLSTKTLDFAKVAEWGTNELARQYSELKERCDKMEAALKKVKSKLNWLNDSDEIAIITEALKEGESNTLALISQDAHEKEVIMQAFSKVRQIFEGREWIMEGRGSYPYNDDRYQEEVRHMYDEFDQLYKDTWHNIKSKSIEYREWIINEYLHKDHPAIHDILTRLGYKRSIDSNTPAPVQGEKEVELQTNAATIEFCYRDQDGGVQIRYRRIEGTPECNAMIAEVEALIEKAKPAISPYFYRKEGEKDSTQ